MSRSNRSKYGNNSSNTNCYTIYNYRIEKKVKKEQHLQLSGVVLQQFRQLSRE